MNNRTERGHALIELALLLPILTTLLLGVVEVGNALNAYLSISEASRECARLIVRKGPSADYYGVAQTLTTRLPNSSLQVNPMYGTDFKGNQKVTVRVTYAYRFIFADFPLVCYIFPEQFTLSAQTTMPIP